MSKIDWTRPLRVVGTHEPIENVRINWTGIRVETAGGDRAWMVRPNGQPTAPYCEHLAVENVPPELRIVERWTEAIPGPHGNYVTLSGDAMQSRFTPTAGRRIAKLLIEESEQ